MDKHKIDNYKKERLHERFPLFQTLKGAELDVLSGRVFQAIEERLGVNSQGFFKLNYLKRVMPVNAEADSFRLGDAIAALNVTPRECVYINWYRFDRIDKMALADLCESFEYIWYSGSDDIEVFDDSLNWMISISHGGQVSLVF